MRVTFIRSLVIAVLFVLGVGLVPGCSCARSGGNGGGNGDMGVPAIGSITVSPASVTLDLFQGQPPPTQAFKVALHETKGDKDVTQSVSWALADPTLGAMNGAVFTAGTTHGGTSVLTATYQPANGAGQQGHASITVKVHGTFQAPDCMNNCPPFPGTNAPPCAAPNITPKVVYPPDGVLLPPNMNVVSVMWTPFPGGPPALPIQEFEIDFQNGATDVQVVTKCAAQTVDTSGAVSAGCEFQLDPATWDFIAKSNRGGDPVTISVRATSDGMCATPSANSVAISFAEQDLNGGLFYWKSLVSTNGVGGNIWAKSFGDAVPEEQITGVAGTNLAPTAQRGSCFGCHALSRDGKMMVVNSDDDDSDDEYGDVAHTLVDVMKKSAVDGHQGDRSFEPGFQTFNPDHSIYLATNGDGSANPGNILYQFDGNTGAALTPAQFTLGPSTSRPTMIDWSADGKSLLFVLPSRYGSWDSGSRIDDDHLFGGSIYAAPYDSTQKTFGMPAPIVMSQGENNYYPSYSPDGSFIIFNRVPQQTVASPIAGNPDCTGSGDQVTCPNDSFSNPKARIWILSTAAGATALDAEKANGSPASSPVDVSNSWPRWSPFIQTYRGAKLLWVTFSSTRDYGLRVLNHKSGMFQCYPADSLQQPGDKHSQPFPAGCMQPQIWMAAINLSAAEVSSAGDPSFPAFWLPFQDITTHNHTAQWTETVVTQPPGDMGMCIPDGADCSAAPNNCCAPDICTSNGTCGSPIS